ncbi:helicase [Paraferrimonas haliotis]|uniref:Helicase n=1 Tax=Paraferrimonas haliotis TaxID=2013866 RepID=A0AA37U0J1_9GAMM|nr:DEAD/DEAH box helicase [Paraferrimonas haliotis]GLS84371.1 helicase [Paraferrimonas haliotis]
MKLRPYQQQSVDAVIQHFRGSKEPAVVVLPTGAGKSIVIAELARLARKKILVVTHVKELVEQNAEKIRLFDIETGVYSAGLNVKQTHQPVIVAGIQSAARNLEDFALEFSLIIVDECHRISDDEQSQYQRLIAHLKHHNPNLCILGLTATPYRLDSGWIYQRHYHGMVRSLNQKPFGPCIFELPMRQLIKQGFLTEPKLYDGVTIQYDFDDLVATTTADYSTEQIERILKQSSRATTQIIEQVIALSRDRQGVLIFAANVRHAKEITRLLPIDDCALITAETPVTNRNSIIHQFKHKQIKYLVNVSVLTTGFDAPHVDLIAILRPTASISLYQQMVGRGLRLSANKNDCLVVDYAANGFDLFLPEIGEPRPNPNTTPVQVPCPECGYNNLFWGKTDSDGDIVEHYGRRCQSLISDNPIQQCSFRFRSRICPDCGSENDIAARQCQQCTSILVDPDKHLSQVLKLKHHHIFRCTSITLDAITDSKGRPALQITYRDDMANDYQHQFVLTTKAQRLACLHKFIRPHQKAPGSQFEFKDAQSIVSQAHRLRHPKLLILKKEKYGWKIIRSLFDYQGRFSVADDAS